MQGLLKIIRIRHESGHGIEKDDPRITVWHHEACSVMANCDQEGQIFQIPSSHK